MPFPFSTSADVAGTIAGVLSVTSYLPQLYRIYVRRSAGDVSFAMYAGMICASLLWMFYAWAHEAAALFITNLVIGIVSVLILLLKRRYRASRRPS
jgi:MtN3 and saliva related transmembrane protein